jgi:hypothetical protein
VWDQITPFEITTSASPTKLQVDPQFDLFRRLSSSEIPPAINSLKGSSSVVVVLCGEDASHLQKTARTLVASLGLEEAVILREEDLKGSVSTRNDLIFLGMPEDPSLLSKMPAVLSLAKNNFTLNNYRYDDSEEVFFGVFEHPRKEKGVVAVFLPLSRKNLETVARKITHYGKYSYLAFRAKKNVEKGIWPVVSSPLIYEWKADRES